MASVRFTGETGSRRHRGRNLKQGETIEVDETTATQLVELGGFEHVSATVDVESITIESEED